MSFIEKLDEKSLEVFNEAAAKPFSQQAVFFLNAFWEEYGDQAEYIYAVVWHMIKMADMNAKAVQYVHLYEEGLDLDFDMGLYFFEQICKFNDDESSFKSTHGDWRAKNKNFKEDFKKSLPVMKTSIVRKKELKNKVDVNFDGRVSMLEYLCYQYEASPKDLIERSMKQDDEPEEVRKARLALEAVNKQIAAYEAEKFRLEEAAKGASGVKAMKAKNELAQLNSSPLWEGLNKALITAEAAVRIATRKFGKKKAGGGEGGASSGPSEGAVWWMNRDLAEKQAKYGRVKK